MLNRTSKNINNFSTKYMFLIHHFLLMLGTGAAAVSVSGPMPIIAKPSCPDKCGNLSIPYPFGTRQGCYLDDAFLITCNASTNTPFLQGGNLEVLNISLEGRVRISSRAAIDCYDKTGLTSIYDDNWVRGGKFYSLSSVNKFIAVGCDTKATFEGLATEEYYTGCMSYCYSIDSVVNGSCSGIGCCQVSVPQGARGVNISLSSYYNHSDVWSYNPCSYAFVVEDGFYNFTSLDLADRLRTLKFPISFDWTIGNTTCAEAKMNPTSYACKDENSECLNSDKRLGYLCNCSAGYRGNPYLSDGCQDIDECSEYDPNLLKCINQDHCNNTIGDYTCFCPQGYHGDGTRTGSGCNSIPEEIIEYSGSNTLRSDIIVGGSVALSVLVILLIAMYGVRKREQRKLKENNFTENGGLMLQQLLSKVERSDEKAKIFTEKELNKATKNFNASGIIGQGSYGTVYKGILENKTIVAIKKSKVMDRDQVEQFVNEVIVLSQIKHLNVVKLLGCCLETPVPLLVYEFVTNNTLHHHLHNQNNNGYSTMSWEIRLDIAVQTASALAHMHSDAPIHIIHRDIKSANILLDDDFQAKVSDFGVSRLVPLDQTQLSTIVLGTFGYIDPEYFHLGLLNHKSDVYSFGVVLAELLTGKKVLSPDGPQKEKYLATLLISSIKEDNLAEILDQRVKNEGHPEQLEGFANLASRCVRLKGEKRPTMKEVKAELEALRIHKRSVVEIAGDIEEAEALLGPPPQTCYTCIDSTKFQASMELESGR